MSWVLCAYIVGVLPPSRRCSCSYGDGFAEHVQRRHCKGFMELLLEHKLCDYHGVGVLATSKSQM